MYWFLRGRLYLDQSFWACDRRWTERPWGVLVLCKQACQPPSVLTTFASQAAKETRLAVRERAVCTVIVYYIYCHLEAGAVATLTAETRHFLARNLTPPVQSDALWRSVIFHSSWHSWRFLKKFHSNCFQEQLQYLQAYGEESNVAKVIRLNSQNF